MNKDDAIVPLRRFTMLHEAELAASALDAAGIVSCIQDAHVAATHPDFAIATGGVLLLVRGDELKAAGEILDGASTMRASEAGDDDGEFTCAGCGRPLKNALADCAVCNAEPDREVLTPRRTYWSIVRLKLWIIAITLAIIFAPMVWDRIAALPERMVGMAAYAVLAVIVAGLLWKTLARFDSRL
jgi:hypothetical protein